MGLPLLEGQKALNLNKNQYSLIQYNSNYLIIIRPDRFDFDVTTKKELSGVEWGSVIRSKFTAHELEEILNRDNNPEEFFAKLFSATLAILPIIYKHILDEDTSR